MHSFLIDMCRSCLKTNVDLKEYMIIENREMRCFDAVKHIFCNVVPANFGYGYTLCEVCVNLLKSAAIFQRRLSKSHNAYIKYMETLNFSNCYQFSILNIPLVNKEYLHMLKTDKGSRVKQIESTCNRISTNEIYFQDILNDEDLNCNTYNDFDNFSGELDTKVDIKENILLTTSQVECKNMENVIDDNEVLISDNRNQLDINITENTLDVRNVKQEHENLFHKRINKIEKYIVISDNHSHNQLDSKMDVKEHIIPWERTINSEDITSPIILTKHKASLIKHKHINPRKGSFKCVVCEKSFPCSSQLSRHKCIHIEERSYKCDICEKPISDPSNLIKHKRIHTGERPHKCDVCEKRFSMKSNLIKHKRIHSGERKYKCDVCEKSFSQKQVLINHKRIHTGERPYNCDFCEARFSHTSSLIIHKRIHTGERPYKCNICEKAFSHSSNLIVHKRTHSIERPYKCDICEKAFPHKSHLVNHKRIHSGERPYKCDVCEKSFSQRTHLITHKRIHTGERPYKCDVCEKSSSRSSHLIRHKRTHTDKLKIPHF